MVRGTTPTLVFNLPFNVSVLKTLYITFKYFKDGQSKSLEKTLDDCQVSEKSIAVTFTQAETLDFPISGTMQIQLRAVTTNSTAIASKIYSVSVDRILKEGII